MRHTNKTKLKQIESHKKCASILSKKKGKTFFFKFSIKRAHHTNKSQIEKWLLFFSILEYKLFQCYKNAFSLHRKKSSQMFDIQL